MSDSDFDGAVALYEKKRYQEAVTQFECIVAIDRNNAQAYNYLGYCYEGIKQHGKAKAAYQNALKIEPDNYVIIGSLCLIFLNEKNLHKAKELLDRITCQKPKDVVTHRLTAYYHKLNNNLDAAREQYEKALWLDSMHAYTLREYANILYKINAYGDAVAQYEKLLSIESDNDELFVVKGYCHEMMGEISKARISYAKALELNPNNADAAKNLTNLAEDEDFYKGLTLMESHRYEEAISMLKLVLEKGRKIKAVLYNLGLCYENAEKYEDAEASYIRALDLEPDDVDSLDNLSQIYLKNKEAAKKARPLLQKLLNLDEKRKALHLNSLGYSYELTGDLIKALDYYEMSVSEDDTDVDSAESLARALYHLKRYDESLSRYEKILHTDLNRVNSLIGKGCNLEELSRQNEAKTCYQRALELDTNNEIARENLEALEDSDGE